MENTRTNLLAVFLIQVVALADAKWSAEGRIGLRLYGGDPKSHVDEPLETGVWIFQHPYYNRSLELLILIHGMDASVDCEFVEGSVKGMFFRGLNKRFNIVALNLPELLARQNIYDTYLYRTAINSRVAGDAVGDFLVDVIDRGYTTPDKIYVVGYSMGAQVAGYLGRKIREAHGKIFFILGLDPAGIGFTASTIAAWFTKLSHVNADDATHTHFWHCNSLMWGSLSRNATANFIFNGGNLQPGCMADRNVACSHNRVPYYFIESVLFPEGFPAQRCDSWKKFQNCECLSEDIREATFPPDLNATGTYYLRTNGKSTFAQGSDGTSCIKAEYKMVVDVNNNEIEVEPKVEDKREEMLKIMKKHIRSRYEYFKTHHLEGFLVPKDNASAEPLATQS